MKEQLLELKKLCAFMYALEENQLVNAVDENYINEQKLCPYVGFDAKYLSFNFGGLSYLINRTDSFVFCFDSGEIYFYNSYICIENNRPKLKLIFSDGLYEAMKEYFKNLIDKQYGRISMKHFNEQVSLERIALKLERLEIPSELYKLYSES